MECIRQNEEKYKGEVIEMPKNKDKKVEETINELHNDLKFTKRFVKRTSVACVTIFTIILGVVRWMGVQLYDLKGITEKNSEAIANMQKDLDKINDGLNGNSETGTNGVYTRLALIEEKLNIPTISASTDMTSSLDKVSIERNDIGISTTSFSENTTVGTDSDGNVYIAKDLIEETILLTYIDGDKEVYFLGQYNENYNWDGFCVTNAYNLDGSLYGICESNFDNGKRLNYKSFVLSDISNNWIFSNRVCDGDKNIGTNIHYSLCYDKIKNFTSTNVKTSDILYVDKFLQNVDATITKYYSGNTSNSLFNDDSGNAYEVIYDKDGTIRTLYMGNFVDGYFNDNTGNAWDIAYSDEYGVYFYNKGKFKNGIFVDNSTTPVSIDEINNIISEYDFTCELKWN